jgi:hypothetical protein
VTVLLEMEGDLCPKMFAFAILIWQSRLYPIFSHPRKNMKYLKMFLLAALVLCPLATASAAPAPGRRHYILLSESTILDECLICGRPSFLLPLRGSFDLLSTDAPNAYDVLNIDFSREDYQITGHGTLIFDPENKTQEAQFELTIHRTGLDPETLAFTNEVKEVTRDLPMLDFAVRESPGSFTRLYTVSIVAAPILDLWFSTTEDFATQPVVGFSREISNGDIITINGRLLKSYTQLTSNLGLFKPGVGYGVDAFASDESGEMLFSLARDAENEQGIVSQGALYRENGLLIATSDMLAEKFGVAPGQFLGLDAYLPLPSGEVYFSITNTVYSPDLDQDLYPGDILSSEGKVVKGYRDLLEKFLPSELDEDYGLDALFVWPSGEIWFSTERDFISQIIGEVRSGDLLSDKGYVVFRNRELLYYFNPAGDQPNFGLDGLMVFPDLNSVSNPTPRITSIIQKGENIQITWETGFAEYRLEKAATVEGPYEPVADWTADLSWTGPADGSAGFFRLTAR